MLEILYIINVTLIILHEIESGYEKEWELLKIPGKLTGFLLLHIPIVFMFFYGFYCIIIYPQSKGILSIVVGIIGFIPFIVHKLIVNRKENFNKLISNIIIIGNMFFGAGSIIIGILKMQK